MTNKHPFLPLHSRSHQLNHFSQNTNVSCFIKRDDELSSGMAGSKCRKYASLFPALRDLGIKHLFLIGSKHSNHILAASQCAREYNFTITALLLKSHHISNDGNFKLSRLLIGEENIIWIERDAWSSVEEIAKALVQKQIEKSFVVPEGGACQHSMLGAQTLADDIIKNEQQLGVKFEHIFLDAGTGLSAIAAIQRLEALNHKAMRYVLLLADPPELFEEKYKTLCQASLVHTKLLRPSNAKSFGAVNTTVKNFIKIFAKQQGVLLDPIYSAKLFFEAQHYLNSQFIIGNVLVVHSGGTLSLPNFNL